jgi:hypothetical protein
MKPKIVYTITLLGLFTLASLSNSTPAGKIPIQNLPLFTGDETISVPNSIPISPPHLYPPSTDDYIGEVDTVGTTWWDMQHIGTAGRMICVDDSDWIHVCWTNSLNSGAIIRHIYYNLNMGTGWAMNGNVGVAVENQYRGGYCCLDVDSAGYPYVIFHGMEQQGQPSHIYIAKDYIPGAGAFYITNLPFPPVMDGLVFPNMSIDQHNRIHVIAHETEHLAGDRFRIFYCQATYAWWYEVAWTMVSATDINTSRVSDRVALTYHAIRPSIEGDITQYNNDVYLIVSEDGITWDFRHPYNITNFIPPDTSFLPDTLAADKDTLRAYTDASVLFDRNDNIHVAFTVIYLDEIGGYISVNNSQIWHWSEATGYFSLVANGWFDGDHRLVNSCGAWQRYVQRPCLAEDETTGDLFITYQQYDPFAVAANGYPQGEIIVSRSTSGGTYWSVGTNVSNTGVDSAEAGECWSERDITCNELMVNDTLHLLYVLDRDAGSVEWSEGTSTQNPVQYQAVPINQIPAIPLMPVYPLHCDSTGMPPSSAVELIDNMKVPSTFHLSQNYPNPFNSVTIIDFDINQIDHLTLKVYNILGQEVATLVNGNLSTGTYRVPFDASNLSSGIYFYRLTSSFQSETRKMVVLK